MENNKRNVIRIHFKMEKTNSSIDSSSFHFIQILEIIIAFFGVECVELCRDHRQPKRRKRVTLPHYLIVTPTDGTRKRKGKRTGRLIYKKISKTHAQSDKCCVYIVHIDVIRQKMKNKKGE